MSRIDWKARGKKIARATVAALVSVWALYVVLINLFLSTSLFERVVNQDKTTLDIHYTSGWSLWPTTIHAKNLSIRASDSNVAWMLRLDEVTFDTSLLDLPRRRFTVNRADGTGISMRVQTRRQTWPDHQEEIKHIPPIDGFPAFGVAPTDPHHPELWDDEQYKLITVSLEDVHAHNVREIWIDNYRYAGDIDIDGRFYLKPLRAVDVGPVRVTFKSGEFQQGPSYPLVQNLVGTVDLTVARFDPREVHENQGIRYFDITTNLRGRSIPLAKLPFVSNPIPFYYDGVVDAQNIALRIEKGRLANGSHVDATIEGAHVAKNNYIGEGLLEMHASVTNDHLVAKTDFATWRIVRADGEELMRAPRAYFGLDSAKLDLFVPVPFDDLHLVAGVDSAAVPDARLTNCILPCTVGVKSGHGALTARAEVWPNDYRVSASGHIVYEDVAAAVPDLDGRGSGDVRATIASYRWDTGVMEGLELHGEFRAAAATARPVPLRRIHAGEGTIDFRAERLELADPLRAAWDADLTLAALRTDEGIEVASADLGLSHRKDTMAVVARVEGGRVQHGAKLSFLPVRLASDHGHFRGHANITNQNDIVRGHVELEAERLGIETKKLALVGNASVTLDIRKLVSAEELDLGPSRVELRNARGRIAGQPAFTADRIQVDGIAKHFDLGAPKMKAIDGHVVLAGVKAPNAAAFQPLLAPDGKLKIVGGAVNVSGEIALAGADGASGDLVVDATKASFTHGESTLTGDLRFLAKVSGVSDDVVNLSGSSLALRNIEVRRSTFETANWSADVVMDDTVVDWASGELAFGTDIKLNARDARPVLAMLHAPKIAGAFVSMPNVAVEAHVDAEPDGFLVRDIYAKGGDVAFRGSYAVFDDDKRGAFVVSKGPIAVGVRLGNDGAHPHFFGLDSWLRDEEKKVKAAPTASQKP